MEEGAAGRAAVDAAPHIAAARSLADTGIGRALPGLKKALAGLPEKLQEAALGRAQRRGDASPDTAASTTTLDTVADALSRDLPGTRWRDGRDGVLDAPWAEDPALLPGLLPIAIAGAHAGLHGNHRTATFAAATDTQLRAMGVADADISAIRTGLERSPHHAARAIDDAFSRLDPSSDTARAAQAELAAGDSSAFYDGSGSSLPTVTRLPDGSFRVDDADGNEIGTALDAEGVQGLAGWNPTEQRDSRSSVSFAIAPLGPGPKRIAEAPKMSRLSDPYPPSLTEPSQLRNHFWKNFGQIAAGWPNVIQTPEGPIAWSKSKAGNKLRSFKDGEPARLHYIAAAHLPELLENSKLASVHEEAKGDRTVQEIHRRYAWAEFPNGQRRHVLLTVERMSEHADPDKQRADQAYSAEILGVSLEVLAENDDAGVVNLKTGGEGGSPSNQAVTPAHDDLTSFLAGIKPEHRFKDGGNTRNSFGDAHEATEGGYSFSVGPDPAGLHRKLNHKVPVLDIGNVDMPATERGRKEFLMDLIQRELAGKTLVNTDSGIPIFFNSGRHALDQAVKGAHSPNVAQGLTRVADIVTGAIHVNIKPTADATGRSVHKNKKASRTEEYHYFMLPVRIGPRNYVAWFNARKTGSYTALVFDSFGMTHLEAQQKMPDARASRNSPREEPEFGLLTSASGEITIAEMLGRIKGDFLRHLPAVDATTTDADLSAANRQMLDILSGSYAKVADLELKGTMVQGERTLADIVSQDPRMLEAARQRARIHYRQAETDMELSGADDATIDSTLASLLVHGTSRNEFARGLTRIVAEFSGRADPLTVLEESIEGVGKYLMDRRGVTREKMLRWIRETEAGTATSILAEDFGTLDAARQRQELIEGWSRIGVAHATGRYQDSQLAGPLRNFFRSLKEVVGQALRLATAMKHFSESGRMDAEMKHWLDVAAGFEPETGSTAIRDARRTGGAPPSLPDPKKLGGLLEEDGDVSFSMEPKKPGKSLEATILSAVAEARAKTRTTDGETLRRTGRFWLSLHGVDGVQQLPKLRSTNLQDLVEEASEFQPGLSYLHLGRTSEGDVSVIRDDHGSSYLKINDGKVWVDTSEAGGDNTYGDGKHVNRVKASMATAVYQIAQAYAKNNGLQFTIDSNGTSNIANFRRWPQLLSSAIRMGDTSHIDGSNDVEGWKEGDHEHNAGLLAMHEYEYVRHFFPEIDGLRLSGDSATIVDHAGAPVSRQTLADLLVGERHRSRLGIGETTLRRAIVTRQTAAEGRMESGSEAGAGQPSERRIHPGAVQNFVPDLGSGATGPRPRHALKEISYSIGSDADSPNQPQRQDHGQEGRMVPGNGTEQEVPGGSEAESRRRIRETLARRERGEGEGDLGDGAESVVIAIDDDEVLKDIRQSGVICFNHDGDFSNDWSIQAAEDKAKVINALGGMKTRVISFEGRMLFIQERGTPITETEYLSIDLPFGIEPTRHGTYKIRVDGEDYLIADLKPENFVKDSQGNIRLIDLITGKVAKGSTPR